jgi:hypothetical protein
MGVILDLFGEEIAGIDDTGDVLDEHGAILVLLTDAVFM